MDAVVPHRFFDERLRDCLRVVVPNGTAMAAINLLQVAAVVQIGVGLITIGYTVWRWKKDSNK